jgi:hypothetical protein
MLVLSGGAAIDGVVIVLADTRRGVGDRRPCADIARRGIAWVRGGICGGAAAAVPTTPTTPTRETPASPPPEPAPERGRDGKR